MSLVGRRGSGIGAGAGIEIEIGIGIEAERLRESTSNENMVGAEVEHGRHLVPVGTRVRGLEAKILLKLVRG